MYCSSCGKALSRQMKFCNHCGVQLSSAKDNSETDASKKRLDEYLDGLFWITASGLGYVLGGMFLLKGFLHLRDGIVNTYLIISSLAFLTNFGLSLWQIICMTRGSKSDDDPDKAKQLDTNRLEAAKERTSLEAGASVTEDTTRAFEPSSKEPVIR